MSRVVSSVGDPTAYDVVTAALLANPAGVTVHPDGSLYRGSGIVVALPGHGHATVSVPPDYVAAWVRGAAHTVTGRHVRPRAFGAWQDTDTNMIYLDVVEIFSDSEEYEALTAARGRGELAVWHNGKGRTIRL